MLFGVKPLKVPNPMENIVTRERLQQAQQDDPSLQRIRRLADSHADEVSSTGSSFHYKNGMLYRTFQSPNVEHGNTYHQVVVPGQFRKQVMHLAHETLFGGHQGAKKTSDKILSSFYWPGITSDVVRYCRSCDVCQRTVPKGRVTKVPL